MSERSKNWLIALLVLVTAFFILTTPRANDYASLLGNHGDHSHHGDDPYRDAVNQENFNCCHGRDCLEYNGTPEKVAGGWQFGPWFVPDKKAIKPETLARRVRGLYIICFAGGKVAALRDGSRATVYCGHAPQSGV